VDQSKKIDLSSQMFRKISIFPGKLTKNLDFLRDEFPNDLLFSHLLPNVRLSRQNLPFTAKF